MPLHIKSEQTGDVAVLQCAGRVVRGEALHFLKEQEKLFPVTLKELIANDKPRPLFVRLFRRLRYVRRERYLNRYAHTVWAVFSKNA